MGDRCNLSLYVHEESLPKVRAVFDEWSDESLPDGDGIVTLGWTEINYGGAGELVSLCRKGVPFYGLMGAGETFGPSLFACDGIHNAEVDCNSSGVPQVGIDVDTGKPLPRDMEQVKMYLDLKKRARAKMTGGAIARFVEDVRSHGKRRKAK